MMNADLLNWALETGLAVSLLIVFILLIRRPFSRRFGARLTYALWALPVVRLFMPAIILPARNTDSAIDAVMPEIPVIFMETATVSAQPLAAAVDWTVLALTIWAGGALLFLAWQAWNQLRFHAIVTRNVAELPDEVRNDVNIVGENLGLKKLPQIVMSKDKLGPLVSGMFRPVIVLPQEFAHSFDARQRSFAIGHELMHIRRHDLWVAAAVLLFRALNWPNPIVHFAASRFRADQEAACDASLLCALGDDREMRHDYAETLLNAARQTVRLTHPRPLGLTIYHPLKERLMILSTKQHQTGLLTRSLAAALIAGAVIASAPFTRAQDSSESMAGEAKVKQTEKKVIKWVEDINGVETKKHYEILTEDGETKAFEIDELGNRMEVDPDTIKGLKMHGDHAMTFKSGTIDIEGLEALDGQNVKVFMSKDGELPEGLEKHIKVIVDSEFEGQDGDRKVIVKKMKSDQDGNVFTFTTDEDITVDVTGESHAYAFGGGSHAKSLVGAAESLAKKAEKSEELTRDQRRKLEKAIKALEDAQKALADD